MSGPRSRWEDQRHQRRITPEQAAAETVQGETQTADLRQGGACAGPAAGLLLPGRLSGVYRAWMGLAVVISKITSPPVMGALCYLLLSPVGGFMRLFGRNPVRHREREGRFWAPASSGGASDLENQF